MAIFHVTYQHADEQAWQENLMPHVQWLVAKLKEGSLRASGPLNGTDPRSAVLIVAAEDREAAEAVLADDPYVINGAVTGKLITEWDPIFGAFNADSSRPGEIPA